MDGWFDTGGGKEELMIEDYASNGVDAYSACCYCQWSGSPTPKSQEYYVSKGGKDTSTCLGTTTSCATIKSALTKANDAMATDITINIAEGNYPYRSSTVHLCKNFISNSHVIRSLTIRGQGEVKVDCGDTYYFLSLGSFNTGRIVNVTVENLSIDRGFDDVRSCLIVPLFSCTEPVLTLISIPAYPLGIHPFFLCM